MGGSGNSGSSACFLLLENPKKDADVEDDVACRGGASTLIDGDDCGLA